MTNTQKLLIGGAAVAVAVVLVVKMSGNDPPAKADAGAPTAVVDTTPPPIMSAPKPVESVAAAPTAAGTSIGLATAAYEAKMVSRAQEKIDKGDYKGALQEIEDYEKIPNRELLTEKATVIKITALSHVGRRTDALALAMETRDDPKFKDYHEQIEEVLVDAGLHQ